MATIKVSEGQTLKDVAVQYLGDATKAIGIAYLNKIELTDDIEIGTLLELPDNVEVEKMAFVQFLKNNKLIPASAIQQPTTVQLEGIGYWHIEDDFVVQ